jgi:hypothetical protein
LLGAPRVVTGAVAIVGVAIVSALIVRDRQAGQRRRTLEPELISILDPSRLDRGVHGAKRHE